MKQRCREAVWWPNLNKDIESFVQHCEACAGSGKSSKLPPPPLQPIPWPMQPWEYIAIDIFGEVQIAPHDQRFLLVVQDLHSKWPEVATTMRVTTEAIIRLLEDLFARWGIPKVLLSDNGTQFKSVEFEDFLSRHGIAHRVTSLYNPQCNGGVERFNQVLKQGLTCLLKEGNPFKEALRTILQNYRATPHALTKLSPAELMIGRKLVLPLDVLKPTVAPTKGPVDIKELAKQVAQWQTATKEYNDAKRCSQEPQLQIGQWVRVKRPQKGHMLRPSLSKPHRLVSRIGPSTFRLDDGTTWNVRRLARSYLKSCSERDGARGEDDFMAPQQVHPPGQAPVRDGQPVLRPRRQ